MKNIICFIFVCCSVIYSDVVYRIPIQGTIDLGLPPYISRELKEAQESGALAVIFDIDTFPYDQTNYGELKKVSDNTGSSDLAIETGAGFEIVTTRNVPPYEQGHGNGFELFVIHRRLRRKSGAPV